MPSQRSLPIKPRTLPGAVFNVLSSAVLRATQIGIAAMLSDNDPADCLAAILDNIADIEDYTAGLEHDAFESDGLTRGAVERCIERVCAAVSHLGECAPAVARDQPWFDIEGVRNQLHHACRPIGADLIWEIVSRDLQALKLFAALTLDRLEGDADDG